MISLEAANPLTLTEFGVILLLGGLGALWLWVKDRENDDE